MSNCDQKQGFMKVMVADLNKMMHENVSIFNPDANV